MSLFLCQRIVDKYNAKHLILFQEVIKMSHILLKFKFEVVVLHLFLGYFGITLGVDVLLPQIEFNLQLSGFVSRNEEGE